MFSKELKEMSDTLGEILSEDDQRSWGVKEKDHGWVYDRAKESIVLDAVIEDVCSGKIEEAKNKYKVGDKVVVTLKGLQAHSGKTPSSAGYSKTMIDYRKDLSKFSNRRTVGEVTKIFPSGSMNVDFGGIVYDIKPYMVEIAKSAKEESGSSGLSGLIRSLNEKFKVGSE